MAANRGRGFAAAITDVGIVLPVLATLWLAHETWLSHQFALDFHHDFWVAGWLVRHGLSPYRWTRRQIEALIGFPYPAAGALAFVPWSLIPRGPSEVAFVLVLLAACVGTLHLLGVRDRRVYTIVLLWCPVVNAWQTANLTLLLACGTAAAWRYRNSPVVAGLLVAVMVSVKPVVWPLGLWLLVTRRYRALAWALAGAAVVNAVSWAVLGVGQISVWWHLLSVETDVLYRQGYGLTALAVHLGASRTAATAVGLLATAAVGAWCVAMRRREREAFIVAVALMVVSSPLVDSHYFALLMVPLALTRPRMGWAWAAPLVLWLCPATGVAGWQVGLAWGVACAVIAWTLGARLSWPGAPGRRAQVAALR